MSSQGVNSSVYSGVTVSTASSPGQGGTPASYPMRDAQDLTLLKKRIGVARALGSERLSRYYDVLQSNENRLSIQLFLAQCSVCHPFVNYPTSGVPGA